jgi:hypothetical protein
MRVIHDRSFFNPSYLGKSSLKVAGVNLVAEAGNMKIVPRIMASLGFPCTPRTPAPAGASGGFSVSTRRATAAVGIPTLIIGRHCVSVVQPRLVGRDADATRRYVLRLPCVIHVEY